MALPQPHSQERPKIKLIFQYGTLASKDYGYLYTRFEFKAMVNNGYIIKAELGDLNFDLLNNLIDNGYFKLARSVPIPVKFQIMAGKAGTYPASATRPQIAILLEMNVRTEPGQYGYVEFVAIDPASWYLNNGDAYGGVWKGRVDQVIRNVVAKYAPPINLEVSRTVDAETNKWWMMRQDPRTFLSSLMDWSSSITQRKTQWLVESDGYDMSIKEQASYISKQRAFYRAFASSDIDTIYNATIVANNGLSLVQNKLITSGLSAVSGQYLDIVTDQEEQSVFVSDSNTSNKQTAKTNSKQAFKKPPDSDFGWSAVTSIPEIYSAGDLGLAYGDYIDGRPRAMWLNLVNSLLHVKFTLLGHGEWSECRGLGIDTVFIKWLCARGASGDNFWWTTGNWLVYGFHHVVLPSGWTTDLLCARFDYDSNSNKVGGS